ncbi:MAG TPA: PASTA domain-containing protein [Nocardioidaceae bacterium]|nr:PASTA domain-containing protein [Nocardioidaceae bacterium]
MERLLREGRARQRQRAFAISAGIAGMVGLTAVAGLWFAKPTGSDSGKPVGPSHPSATQAGVAQRSLGIDGVTVSVPAAWQVSQPSCSTPTSAYVFFTSKAVYNCPDEGPTRVTEVPSLEIGSMRGGLSNGATTDQQEVNGLAVREAAPQCLGGFCTQTFSAGDVAFTVRHPREDFAPFFDSILSSVNRVQEGFTTVPFIEPGLKLDSATQLVEQAGLRVQATRVAASSIVESQSPEAGTVAKRGSLVTLTLSTD